MTATSGNIIVINERDLNDRISSLMKIKNDYIVALNKTDFQFPDTSLKIKEIMRKNDIPLYLDNNIYYLSQAWNRISNLDSLYARLNPVNFEESINKYHNIEIETVKGFGTDNIKEIAKGLDYYNSKIDNDGSKLKKLEKTNPWGSGIVAAVSIVGDTINLATKKAKKVIDYTEYGIKTTKNVVSAGKSIASWAGKKGLEKGFKIAGYGLNTALSFVNNYKEYGRFSKRMVLESCCEATIGIVKTIGLKVIGDAIGVGATVALTPFLGPLAPVAGTAIGAISGVVIECAADYVCEKITGKDITELLSDVIVDGVDYITGGAIGQDSTKIVSADIL